jgi:tetratricopeptide (TPR) repeat protein
MIDFVRFAPLAPLLLVLVSCASVEQPQGPRPSAFEALVAPQRSRAGELAAAGRLREALDKWKVALAIDPTDAIALEESKKLDARIKESVAERLARGRDALKRNVHLEARSHFLAVLAMEPGNREAFEALQTHVREVRQIQHTVRAGESLASIAQLYYGDRTRSEVIWETNHLPANPKLSPGMTLRIPEIPGLPFGRSDPSRGRPDIPPAPGSKSEPSEDGPYANPILAEAREAMEKGDYVLALNTVDQFLGQNPRNGEALDLKRVALMQQSKNLMEQNKLTESLAALTQLAKLSPKDTSVSSLMSSVRGRLVQQHYNQGIRFYREEKLPAAIAEWRRVLQYEPGHEGAKRNIEQAERLLKGLQVRQQKQTK